MSQRRNYHGGDVAGDAATGDVMQVRNDETGEWDIVPIPPPIPPNANTSQFTVRGTKVVLCPPTRKQPARRQPAIDDDYQTQEFPIGGNDVIGRDLYQDRVNYNYPTPMSDPSHKPVKTVQKRPAARAPRPEDQYAPQRQQPMGSTKKRWIGAAGLFVCGVLGWTLLIQPAWNWGSDHWNYGGGYMVNQGTLVISGENYTVMSWYVPSDGKNPGDVSVNIQSADEKKHMGFDTPIPPVTGDHKKSVTVKGAKGADGKDELIVLVDNVPAFTLVDNGHQGLKIK